MSQPPKNSVVTMAHTVTTLAYSAMKKNENFIALYSVWYPAISSDSASGRSNGSRLVSAKPETRKMKNDRNSGSTYQSPACWSRMIAAKLTLPLSSSTGIEAHPHRDLVGDHLRAGPEPAEQGVLAVGRPARERDPVHPHRADGEDEEEADRQVRDDHRHQAVMDEAPERPEGEVEVHRQRRGERDHGREHAAPE